MSIHPIIRNPKTPDERADGWQVRTRTYPIEHGRIAPKLVPIKQNFPASKGYTLRDAEKWEREQLATRDKRELELRFQTGDVAPSNDRTLEEMAEYYFQHEDFTETAPSTQIKIRRALREFLEWNAVHGRPTATLWDEDLARKRIHYLAHEFERPVAPHRGVIAKKGRRGAGTLFHAIYNKKLFSLELQRKDSTLKHNPWPPKWNRKRLVHRAAQNPRAYTASEVRALFDVMEPYERLLFLFLYATGCRSNELLSLRIDQISFGDDHQPEKVHFVKTKNYKDRTVPLSIDAIDAVNGLLASAGGSGYLVRREFLHSKHARITTPLHRALGRIKKRAAERFPEHRHAFLDRVDETDPNSRFITNVHTFRATFATELLLQGVNVVTVAQLIGDTVETLLKHYAAILNRDHEKAVLKLPRINTNATKYQPSHGKTILPAGF